MRAKTAKWIAALVLLSLVAGCAEDAGGPSDSSMVGPSTTRPEPATGAVDDVVISTTLDPATAEYVENFEFVGEKTGSGSYRGNWVKITRRAPGATLMHLWLAYDKDARGGYTAFPLGSGEVSVRIDPNQ